jgi:hypothetical protein
MMLPEEAFTSSGDAVFSDAFFFDTLMDEVAEGAPTLPRATAMNLTNPTAEEPPQAKDPLLVEDETVALQPPSTPGVCSTHQFRRIPCKARGMSNKHNSDTAFLDIPADAPHGLLLSCSHPECAESGRKFRYCSICASPVAQRNFPKRHGHRLIESARDLLAVDYTSSFKDISVFEDASGYPCVEQTVAAPTLAKPSHRRVVSFDAARLASQAAPVVPFATSCLPLSEQRVAPVPPASKKEKSRHRRGVSFDATRLAGQVAFPTDSTLNLSTKEQQWLDLLNKRVVVKRPVATRRATDSLLNLGARKLRWLDLFHKHPDLEHGLNRTEWMDEISSFSDKEGSSVGNRR